MPAECHRTFAFAFVCHAGDLEAKAVLLAASLVRQAPPQSEFFAAVPQPANAWGRPSEATLDAFAELGVRVVGINAPFRDDRSHGNKIAALRVPASADRLVLLDTDILALSPFRDRPAFDADVAAKPADYQTWSDDLEVWRRTFEVGGATLPDERVVTTVSGETSPPYYNSGVLVVGDPTGLADEWERCARALNEAELPFGETWSDQPSLAVALRNRRARVAALDETLNFPAHVRRFTDDPPVVLCHYHWPRIVERSARLCREVRRLAERHPVVGELLAMQPDWSPVLESPARV